MYQCTLNVTALSLAHPALNSFEQQHTTPLPCRPLSPAVDPAFVAASTSSPKTKTNPRYLDSEVQMKFGEGPDGNPRTRGLLVRRFTAGNSTPWTFPVRPVKLVKEWPEKPPFKPENFLRADQQDDGSFYAVPRFVYHIDESAVATWVDQDKVLRQKITIHLKQIL